jgi:glycosyltransferase involved in cell wall biosynthesis
MAKIYQEINGMNNVYIITKPLTRIEMLSLINVVDSYVSLHRAEGFGLIQAEAMALGKPVIMTYWSGNTDMMTAKNCIGIEYKLVKIKQDQGPYEKGEIWAEPDLTQSVDSMRLLFNNSDMCRQIGKEAKQTINNLYSPEIVGKKIRQRVREIGV